MPSLLLALVLLLACATAVAAEEPKGFLTWPWGTPPDTLVEKFVRVKYNCSSSSQRDPFWAGGRGQDIICDGYMVGDTSTNFLMLYFEPAQSLAGYSITFPWSSYKVLRQTIVSKFGKPSRANTTPYRTALGAHITGEGLTWQWPSGTGAELYERCPAGGEISTTSSCITVGTKALQARGQREQRENEEKRKKGF